MSARRLKRVRRRLIEEIIGGIAEHPEAERGLSVDRLIYTINRELSVTHDM
jgi:hypothetical protein